MKTRESRPLREHFEVSTDAGEALRTFDYIEELEAYINHLEALRQPAVMPSCEGNCGMNYCDENGCVERKRILVEPRDLPEHGA